MEDGNGERRCPGCRQIGRTVDWITVAALTVGPLPPRRRYRVCRERACDTVYFGDDGDPVTTDDVSPLPGFKDGTPEALLCYCFLIRQSDVESAVRRDEAKALLDRIRSEMAADRCACEVRNPLGRCCLGTLSQAVSDASSAG